MKKLQYVAISSCILCFITDVTSRSAYDLYLLGGTNCEEGKGRPTLRVHRHTAGCLGAWASTLLKGSRAFRPLVRARREYEGPAPWEGWRWEWERQGKKKNNSRLSLPTLVTTSLDLFAPHGGHETSHVGNEFFRANSARPSFNLERIFAALWRLCVTDPNRLLIVLFRVRKQLNCTYKQIKYHFIIRLKRFSRVT